MQSSMVFRYEARIAGGYEISKGRTWGGEEKKGRGKVGGGIPGGGATGREGDFWLLLEIREDGRLYKVSVHARTKTAGEIQDGDD
ncbi:hypothetical protein TRIATDRAFT_256555 [Trichoderma atroviride IMI 206040]|uniref:Uncharacterized protein n=1 Tax=Hypocrea atroviridis (strain ATCC 20476 / IMI 206040) TaxID=452589 RepID=G9NRS2_HYPAI|nr:uncharacterized protein TRIATDRAFT_256555 [Trichoderma atroviride IMI 206040]EHK46704.1 hypothetical protein TRIATDRAFT_256555 [Trichoderma atroviride IMI 206040]